MACYIAIITLGEIPIYVILDKKRVQKWPSLSCTVKLGLTAAKLKKNFWPPKGSSLSTALMVCISCRKEKIRAITFLWVKQEPYMSFRNVLQIALYRLSRLYLSASVHSHACTHPQAVIMYIKCNEFWKNKCESLEGRRDGERCNYITISTIKTTTKLVKVNWFWSSYTNILVNATFNDCVAFVNSWLVFQNATWHSLRFSSKCRDILAVTGLFEWKPWSRKFNPIWKLIVG